MKVIIRNFRGFNPQEFSHLFEGSEHETIEAPAGSDTKAGQVWIRSATGKPMRLLAKEYERVDEVAPTS